MAGYGGVVNCPKCDAQGLTSTQAGEIEVDLCQGCGGLWLDQSELPRLLELDPSQARALRRGRTQVRNNARRADCPRCGREMLRVASAQSRKITVDSCPDCGGVWLDGGEFDQLFEAGPG